MTEPATTFTVKVLGEFLAHHAELLRVKPMEFPEWYTRYRFVSGEFTRRAWRKWLRRFLHQRERHQIETNYKPILAGLKDGSWRWVEYDGPFIIDLRAEPYTEEELANNPYGKGESVKIRVPYLDETKTN